MKLSVWAEKQGIAYITAWRMFHENKLPVKAYQLPTSTIIVQEDEKSKQTQEKIVVYGRVSSHNKKEDLERQISTCEQFAFNNGWCVNKTYKEIASGMNDKRKTLYKMLESNPDKIIVTHKDRLTRFGFNYLEYLLKEKGCEIIVINRDKEDERDLMKDLASIITSFCCRLYGLRRGKMKAKTIKKEFENVQKE